MESLVAIVKAGQKNSSDFKNKWSDYCANSNEGLKDPMKHSVESLENFVQSIKDEYSANHWFSNPEQYQGLNNPSKLIGGGGPSGDVRKDNLVTLIKAGQRQSNEWKNAWAEWTTSQLNSVRDPSAHDADTLQRFVDAHKEPYVQSDWFNRPLDFAPKPRMNNGNGTSNFSGSASQFTNPLIQSMPTAMNMMMNPMIQQSWFMMKESTGPAPNDLVQMIKDGQRSNQNFKEQWGQFCDTYCDGIRDPTRHPAANIIQFCEMMGIMPGMNQLPPPLGGNPAAQNMNNRFRPY